ncbi:amidohydrolase family protein [Actinomadura sp. 9N407]|uniref:amidohydrolase family protein n=1 Tax=Actinomadura sp. 9N407 TaxID=3375154 RepID=UPI0037ABCDA7
MTITDVHTHLAPRFDRLPEGIVRDGAVYELDGERVGMPGLYQPAWLQNWLDERGIARAWVSAPPPFYRQGLGDSTAAWVQALNDGLAAAIDGQERLGLLVYLPLDEPEAALAEIARWRGRDAVGWTAAAGGGSRPLDDETLTPVWQALAASGRPVLLHPGSSLDRRLDRYYLSNLLGNPVETTVAAAQLVFGDVLGRHRELKIVLVHCGGAVAALSGRWQRGVDTARPGVAPLTLEPRAAIRRLWVDSLSHSAGLLDLAIEAFGPDRVVLGSDWPFPMGSDDPLRELQKLPKDVGERIASDNAAYLVGGGR